MSGRRITLSVTRSITFKLVRVWLETWPTHSPVTRAWIWKVSATWPAARIIIRLSTTPIWPLSIFSRISATTGSKSMAVKRTLWEAPNLLHR
ncbi:hypothetical protein D3C72_2147920 [compost metagenome]